MTTPKTNTPITPFAGPIKRSPWRYGGLVSWRGRFTWLLGMILVAFLVLWIAARRTPTWYRPLDTEDPRVAELYDRAQKLIAFELRTAAERVPLGEQRWTITQDEINSFLGTLDEHLDPNAPFGDPFVSFTPGTITVAARVKKLPGDNPNGGVGSLTFSVGVVRDGPKPMGLVKLTAVHVGYLSVPPSMVEDRLRAGFPTIAGAVNHVIDVQLSGHNPEAIEDSLKIAAEQKPFPLEFKFDKKSVVIKDLIVADGSFTLVLASPVKPATSATTTSNP